MISINNNAHKKAKLIFVEPLIFLINQTLTTGEFPIELKLSKVRGCFINK